MLQNSRVTAFTVFELLRENQLEGKITPLPPTQIRVKFGNIWKKEPPDMITKSCS